MFHISLLIIREILDESLEWLSSFWLSRARPSAEELSDAVLQNLIDKVLVAKRLFLLSVLPYNTHDLTETIRVVNRHFHPGKWLSFVQEQIDMGSHLLLFFVI